MSIHQRNYRFTIFQVWFHKIECDWLMKRPMRNQLSDFEIIESEEDISSLTEAKLSEPNKELQFVTWSYDETKKTDWQAVATGTTLDQYHYFCYRYDPWTTIFTNDLAKRS